MVAPLLLVALLLGAAPVPTTAPQGPERSEATPSGQDLRDARARWEALSEDERRELQRRFEQFRQLDEPRRRELRERARRLDEIDRDLRRNLPPELERELDGLPPPERRQRVREWVHERLEERGRRIRGKLPRDTVERLERAPPGRRGALAEGLRREWRDRHAERVLDELVREGHLDPARAEELRALPPEQRLDGLLELRRERVVADVARRGLPPGVTEDEWARWSELPTRQFFERFHRAAGPPPGRPGSPDGHRPGPPRAKWGPDRRGGAPAVLPEHLRAWREVRGLLDARPPGGELEAPQRARVLELLGELPDTSPEQVESLRALRGQDFERGVRELGRAMFERRLGPPPPDAGGDRGGAGRPPGRRGPAEGRRGDAGGDSAPRRRPPRDGSRRLREL